MTKKKYEMGSLLARGAYKSSLEYCSVSCKHFGQVLYDSSYHSVVWYDRTCV